MARLPEFGTGISGAVVLEPDGRLAAWGARREALEDELDSGAAGDPRGARMRELALELLREADSNGAEPCSQLEVAAAGGAVFAVRGKRYTLAVVAPRTALSSLMLYDLRSVVDELEAQRPDSGSTS